MKTIFRSTVATLMFAAIMALGAAATFAQDPCADADGISKLDAQIRDMLTKKGIDDVKSTIDLSKQFLEKYGTCAATKDFSDYLTAAIPKLTTKLDRLRTEKEKKDLVTRFDAALNSTANPKNWDDLYAAGKDLLNKYPDDFRVVEVVLGSIGLDETAKSPRVTKWNDDTLRFAKLTIQDLESGKLKVFGVKPFIYLNKDDAIAWMNYTVGYILTFDKNNKKEGAAYLYKAAQATASETRSNPVVYQSIGAFYSEEGQKLLKEYNDLVAKQADSDTPDVKKQKIEAIKAKQGMLNGTLERAMDAFSRAWTFAKSTTPAEKAYKDNLFKTLGEIYKVRFEKADGLDAWVKGTPAKPMPDPTTTITPVIDPDPVPTTTTSTTPTAPAATPVKPVTPTTPKPAASVKPQAVVTGTAKPVVKKAGTRK